MRDAAANVDLDDMQGLLRFGYGRHTEACFLLLRVADRDAARHWLTNAPVASAVTLAARPPVVLQVALSSEGLRALAIPDAVIGGFSTEYVAGMSGNASRERRLGDIGGNDPDAWAWGSKSQVPHVLLMLYALPGALADWQRGVEDGIAAGFEIIARLPSYLSATEPFGFADGLSQPTLDWQRTRPARDVELQDYTNLACLGEFVLGYPNEYGAYTDRPLLDPQGAAAALPRAEDAPDRADLGRNGSYLVMRQLQQDVDGFWRTLTRLADGNAARGLQLAEAMVGRRMNGEPLAAGSGPAGIEGNDAAGDLNAFTYRDDPHGLRCPLGAHVRRANPRNADLPPGGPGLLSWAMRTLGFDADALAQDLVASTRFHRLLRRGRAYGERGAGEQGLHFVCLNASIGRQFEFVQAAWIAGAHFDGLQGESDPLLGNREHARDGSATDAFSIPQRVGPAQRLDKLPQFVSVRGGAYFFLPGIRALRVLATLA
jgi:Dyp-type peroxidase family